MLSFLVANKVDFKPDISGKFSAVVKVVRPEATSPAASPSLGADKAADQINMAGWVPSASSTPSTSARTEETPGAGKGTSLTAVQSELKKRFPTFTGLLPALGQHPKTMTKAELLSFIEEVYTARYNQDLLQIQQHAEAEAFHRRFEDSGLFLEHPKNRKSEAVGVQKKKKPAPRASVHPKFRLGVCPSEAAKRLDLLPSARPQAHGGDTRRQPSNQWHGACCE
ncbi:fabB [Symbiodinium necroappetens]|uniref:FabB protein n=1 Tax=Symbiodinium necroappetens TaxID=1628268 RepID=A0A812QJ32_9DINO|nr:fabB [Symbiodinium necroappetens]